MNKILTSPIMKTFIITKYKNNPYKITFYEVEQRFPKTLFTRVVTSPITAVVVLIALLLAGITRQ